MRHCIFFLHIIFIISCLALLTSGKARAENMLLYIPALVAHGSHQYSISIVTSSGQIEYRFYCDDHHFMTLIKDNGTMNLRPHPGVDANGWGSSWYAQPFLPGATLAHTTIQSLTADSSGIHIVASGGVSSGASSTYGSWSMTLDVQYNKNVKIITSQGCYSIILASQLSATTGDLNLYKIASNYLDDVPLLSGTSGDTGDMQRTEISHDAAATPFAYSPWSPPDNPGFFPTDETDYLTVHVIGQCNNVDTAAQGYDPIQPAYKPNMKITLASRNAGTPIRFGAIYNTGQGADYWADNVGITPIISQNTSVTTFIFNIFFESTALPGDGGMPCHYR